MKRDEDEKEKEEGEEERKMRWRQREGRGIFFTAKEAAQGQEEILKKKIPLVTALVNSVKYHLSEGEASRNYRLERV